MLSSVGGLGGPSSVVTRGVRVEPPLAETYREAIVLLVPPYQAMARDLVRHAGASVRERLRVASLLARWVERSAARRLAAPAGSGAARAIAALDESRGDTQSGARTSGTARPTPGGHARDDPARELDKSTTSPREKNKTARQLAEAQEASLYLDADGDAEEQCGAGQHGACADGSAGVSKEEGASARASSRGPRRVVHVLGTAVSDREDRWERGSAGFEELIATGDVHPAWRSCRAMVRLGPPKLVRSVRTLGWAGRLTLEAAPGLDPRQLRCKRVPATSSNGSALGGSSGLDARSLPGCRVWLASDPLRWEESSLPGESFQTNRAVAEAKLAKLLRDSPDPRTASR